MRVYNNNNNNNNNNSERISRALFHVKHAQLRWTGANTKIENVSQGRICFDNLTCCHTEIEVADPTFYLTQSPYTDTGPTSPSTDPITPGAWQGSHWSVHFEVTGMTRPRRNPGTSEIRTQEDVNFLQMWTTLVYVRRVLTISVFEDVNYLQNVNYFSLWRCKLPSKR